MDLSDGFSLNRNLCTELEDEEEINPAVADVFPILIQQTQDTYQGQMNIHLAHTHARTRILFSNATKEKITG